MLQSGSSRSRTSQARLGWKQLLIAVTALALSGGAAAQAQEQTTPEASAPAPAPTAEPSLVELKAAAYDAQEQARQAEAAAAEASAAAAAAREAVGLATGTTPAPVPAPVAPTTAVAEAPPAPTPPPEPAPAAAETAAEETAAEDATNEELRRATEEARNAAAAARAATAALQEHLKEREARYSRSGFYLSGGVFWAPELFDTSLQVADSRGAFGALGYHLGERFDIEARFDAVDVFELASPYRGYVGQFDGWSATLNGRVFLLTNVFQPYFGMGLGVMQGKTRYTQLSTGRRIDFDDTVALFRVSAGFDFYVSENVALTADAAINMPGGELSAANFATLGGGLKLRF